MLSSMSGTLPNSPFLSYAAHIFFSFLIAPAWTFRRVKPLRGPFEFTHFSRQFDPLAGLPFLLGKLIHSFDLAGISIHFNSLK